MWRGGIGLLRHPLLAAVKRSTAPQYYGSACSSIHPLSESSRQNHARRCSDIGGVGASSSPCLTSATAMDMYRHLERAKTTATTHRTMAHVTGHKKSKGGAASKKRKDSSNLQRKRSIRNSPAASSKKFVDPSSRPDYPLGPNYQHQDDNDESYDTDFEASATFSDNTAASAVTKARSVIVPPAMLLPTASPHVYVAKVACLEAGIDSRQLFTRTSVERHESPNRPYSFTYCVPHSFSRPKHHSSNSLGVASSSSTSTSLFPTTSQPEVAFLGRSNVGKSSLVNALMRQTLAVTSKQPGRTQQAYYYGWMPNTSNNSSNSNSTHRHVKHALANAGTTSPLMNPSHALGFLVDLPGYGYAVGSDEAVHTWQSATQDFLLHRRDHGTLRRVYVLQDTRLQSPQAIDQDVQTWLDEAEIAYSVVLTKADSHHQPTTISSSTANGNSSSGSPTAGVIKHVNLCSLRYQQLWSEANAAAVDDDSDSDDDEGSYESDENEVRELGAIMMSPVVHVTSSKKKSGLAELLSSIETEFLAATMDDEDEDAM